jgi:hypothetical protein
MEAENTMLRAFFEQDKRFFMDDVGKIAEYVRAHCAAEAAEIIALADDVCNQSFMFTLRWDMERTWVPVVFPGEIDWLHLPADDPEWIYAFNRHRFWICLGQAYALTGDEKYAQAFVRQFTSWITNVQRADPQAARAWRTIETGLRLEYWLKAFCYFAHSPSLSEEAAALFLGSVVEHAEYLLSVYGSFHLMSNWGVLENHGLFLAGVMLPESERTREYRAEALRRLAEQITIQVYADGTQWEQSPMYHNEVAHCYLDVLILAARNGIELPEVIRRKVRDMCYVDLYWKKPNHREVCMGDSDDIDVRDIITKGAYLYRDPVLKFGGYAAFDFDTIWDLGYAALAEYAEIPSTPPAQTANALADSGNFYLRSDWTEDANFLHFHCGTLGAGHGHSDKLHFDLFANGEDILVDAGRFTYVDKPERYLFKDPHAHNTITVDGQDFTVCIDSWGCSKLARAVNTRLVAGERYDYMEGGHLGYADLSTGSVFVNRRILYLKPDIYLVVDEFYAHAAHIYNQYFHFDNRGELSAVDGGYRFASAKNCVDVQFVTAAPPAAEIVPSKLSRHYNLAEDNAAIKTTVPGDGFTSVITAIATNPVQRYEPLRVEKVAVSSNFKGIVFADSVIEAVNVTKGERSYTVVIAHQEYASPTDTFNADGCTGFGNVVVFDRSQDETRIGKVLLW